MRLRGVAFSEGHPAVVSGLPHHPAIPQEHPMSIIAVARPAQLTPATTPQRMRRQGPAHEPH